MRIRPKTDTPQAAEPVRVPASIWILGFVSMLMDISSEMIHSLLPLFMAVSYTHLTLPTKA